MTYFLEIQEQFPEIKSLIQKLDNLRLEHYMRVADKNQYISTYGSNSTQELVAEAFAYSMVRAVQTGKSKEVKLKAAVPVLQLIKEILSITNPEVKYDFTK